MSKPNFQQMSKQELRAYVLEHRDDQEAFYALTNKLKEEPGIEITSMEQLRKLIEENRDKTDVKDARVILESASQIGTKSLEDLKRKLGQ
ncbi:MAG: hypothetical protein QNJ51_27890 [Calothrix sp. MO_167.B12]|nr:hypothetical protein [Calothrix sp. MO_167.B12]